MMKCGLQDRPHTVIEFILEAKQRLVKQLPKEGTNEPK